MHKSNQGAEVTFIPPQKFSLLLFVANKTNTTEMYNFKKSLMFFKALPNLLLQWTACQVGQDK